MNAQLYKSIRNLQLTFLEKNKKGDYTHRVYSSPVTINFGDLLIKIDKAFITYLHIKTGKMVNLYSNEVKIVK